MKPLRNIFYHLLLYSYFSYPPKPSFFRNYIPTYNDQCTNAAIWLMANGILVIADIFLLVRMICGFKFPADLPESTSIILYVAASCALIPLYGYIISIAEELVTKAFTETGKLSTTEVTIGIVCNYVPVLLMVVLFLN